MKHVFTTEGKIKATVKFSTPETTSSQLPAISITSRISEFVQHLYIFQTTHPHSNSATEKGTFIQWYVNFKWVHQEKPLTLLRGHPQLAHQNSNDQKHQQFQEEGQPTH